MSPGLVRWAYARLSAAYGPQHWWPAETPFEVMLGAVLTQNTAWTNVERALTALAAAGVRTPRRLEALAPAELEVLIRPAGTFRVKARRLRALCAWLREGGGQARLARRSTEALRAALLRVHGIGPETADAILLYAFGRAVFVVDAYARRILGRLGVAEAGFAYEQLRVALQGALPPAPPLLNEYHALLVAHAKARCRARAPQCADCPLRRRCAFASAPSGR